VSEINTLGQAVAALQTTITIGQREELAVARDRVVLGVVLTVLSVVGIVALLLLV
jgi:hypothetical protein